MKLLKVSIRGVSHTLNLQREGRIQEDVQFMAVREASSLIWGNGMRDGEFMLMPGT